MLDFLKEYADSGTVRFHMPGHKGKDVLKALAESIPGIDITEIEGSDNLHDAKGIIRESQNRAASLFGAKETIYSVNGSTAGIYAAVTGVVNPKEEMLLQRNSHKAAYNALMLGDISADYIYPEYSEELGLTLGVTPDQIEASLKNNTKAKAVFLTSPSYYGICLDLKRIAEVVHRNGAVLIVDEAHGSHLGFSGELPLSALESGADIVVQSTHKTLPAFTQSSMVHIGSDRVDVSRIKKMAALYQSTSPSYILMSSLDYAVTFLLENGEKEFKAYIEKIKRYRQEISDIENVKLVDKSDISRLGFGFDFTKIVFNIDGCSGSEVENLLRDRNIELEMSDLYYGVALSSFLDSESDFIRLKDAVKNIAFKEKPKAGAFQGIRQVKPEKKLEIRDAFYREKQLCLLEKSVGKTAGEMVIPYPPGIPLLVPGETVDEEAVSYIEHLQRDGHSVQGVENGKIEIIREV